jgi:uncharacterized membrane-anchored protein YhcB (DUF1043 family)
MKKVVGVVAVLLSVSIGFAFAQIDTLTIKQQDKNDKELQKLREKHQYWSKCFVVTIGNDTVYGKIKFVEDYSATAKNMFFSRALVFANKDETERKFMPEDINELYVNVSIPEHRKYVSLGKANHKQIYRVIIDGKCKLLYDAQLVGGDGMVMEQMYEHYYVYYKNQLSVALTETEIFSIPLSFQKKSKSIFSDCPSVLEQTQNKSDKSDGLRDVVKQFNKCIESK